MNDARLYVARYAAEETILYKFGIWQKRKQTAICCLFSINIIPFFRRFFPPLSEREKIGWKHKWNFGKHCLIWWCSLWYCYLFISTRWKRCERIFWENLSLICWLHFFAFLFLCTCARYICLNVTKNEWTMSEAPLERVNILWGRKSNMTAGTQLCSALLFFDLNKLINIS